MELRSKRNRAGQALLAALFAALLTMCLELGLGYLKPGSVSSVPAHLIHFGIMLVLVSGLWLPCVYCTPFRKAWAWLDAHLMDGAKRKPAVEICYAVLAGLMLLHHFYVIIYYPVVTSGAVKLAPLWLLLAGLTVMMGKIWRDKGVLLASLSLIFAFERLFLKNLALTGNDTVYFFTGIYAVFIAYSLFFVLRPAFRIPFLKAFCALWSLGMLAYCAAGLYTAWTGVSVYNLAEDRTVVQYGRLIIFTNATTVAGSIACGTVVALLGFALVKNKIAKACYLLVGLISALTVSLTGSRSGFMMTGFMISGTICLCLWQLLKKKVGEKKENKKIVLAAASLLLCFILCFFLAVEGQRQLSDIFMKIRDERGMLISSASAEGEAEETPTKPPPSFRQRDAWITDGGDINGVLSGRFDIWQTAFKYIQDHPETLLTGLSVDGSVAGVANRSDHIHNILLQVLLEGGLPGLFLYLALSVYFFIQACSLWKRNLSLWQWMLPLPVLAILLMEMAECLTHFSFGHPPVTIFWFFMGCTVAVSKTVKQQEVAARPEKEEVPAGTDSENREE